MFKRIKKIVVGEDVAIPDWWEGEWKGESSSLLIENGDAMIRW